MPATSPASKGSPPANAAAPHQYVALPGTIRIDELQFVQRGDESSQVLGPHAARCEAFLEHRDQVVDRGSAVERVEAAGAHVERLGQRPTGEKCSGYTFNLGPTPDQFLPRRMETPSPDILQEVIDKLAAAERPVIVAGRGAMMSGARDELVKLGERVGALLATSLQGKGFFAGEEWNVGIAGAFASPPSPGS